MIQEFLSQFFEQHLFEIFYKIDENDRDVNFWEVVGLMKEYGYDINSFESWNLIKELRHFVNVIKHST